MRITHIDIRSKVINTSFAPPINFPPERAYNKITLATSTLDYSSPFILRAAEGLEMPEIAGNLASRDARMNFGAIPNREISFLIGLNSPLVGNLSVSDLRDDFYKIVNNPGDGTVKLDFMFFDEKIGDISGYISGIEANSFSKDSNILLRITCEDPFIRGEKESLTDLLRDDLLTEEMIDSDTLGYHVFWDSKSTAPHGVEMMMVVKRAWNTFQLRTVYHDGSGSWFALSTQFAEGDKLYINSNYGELDIIKYRKNSNSSSFTKEFISDDIASGSVWPIIYPNVTVMGFPSPRFGPTPGEIFEWETMTHRPTYWGV